MQILAKGSFCEKWFGDINGKEYSHSRVFKISGDQFYALLTGQDDAFSQLYKALPIAISDFLSKIDQATKKTNNSAVSEIIKAKGESNRTILDQITFENYGYYLGFDKL